MYLHQDIDNAAGDSVLELRRRAISSEQMHTFEKYMTEIFTAFGMDIDTPSTYETPQRFLRALFEATGGYDGDPKLLKVFGAEYRGEGNCRLSQIIEGPIPFHALCEHHALPFSGRAYIGYIADEHILGISKLTRLVRLFARRFTVQERLVQQIAEALNTLLQPHGVAVYLEAHHLCMQMRGVCEITPLTRTTTWRGVYELDSSLRVEFLLACGADL
ncbi:MAG TPA: GTP cyclohydrolase I [Ktedonobacteraceae bacterium]|nr:GTP cyclohydrolase I [Ktedonobacteraceae bacterium]